MSANEMNKIINDFHMVIQNVVTPTPRGENTNSIFSLMMPGQPIQEDQYYYIDYDNPDKDPIVEEMNVIVNKAIKLSPVYSPTQVMLHGVYGNIIKTAKLPQSEKWTAEQEKTYNASNKYVKENTGTYNRCKVAYDKINRDYWDEKNKKSRSSDVKRLQSEMECAYLQWQAEGKEEFEYHKGIVRELGQTSVGSYFARLSQEYDSAANESYAAKFTPPSWALENDNLPWTQLAFNARQGSSKTSITQEEKTIFNQEFYKQTNVFSQFLGWFRPSPKSNESTTQIKEFAENMNKSVDFQSTSISCELARVDIYREWMDLGVLTYKNVKVPLYEKGGISSGIISPNNNGSMPGYISALILAKNIRINLDVSYETMMNMKNMTDEKKNFKTNFTCGAHSVTKDSHLIINKSASGHSESEYVISIVSPGKQIIGFVNTLVPYFPYV